MNIITIAIYFFIVYILVMENQLLTTKEVAEKLGVTDARVRAMILAGRLPAQSFGRAHMIKESDLALVAERKAGRPKKETSPAAVPSKSAKKAKGKAQNAKIKWTPEERERVKAQLEQTAREFAEEYRKKKAAAEVATDAKPAADIPRPSWRMGRLARKQGQTK